MPNLPYDGHLLPRDARLVPIAVLIAFFGIAAANLNAALLALWGGAAATFATGVALKSGAAAGDAAVALRCATANLGAAIVARLLVAAFTALLTALPAVLLGTAKVIATGTADEATLAAYDAGVLVRSLAVDHGPLLSLCRLHSWTTIVPICQSNACSLQELPDLEDTIVHLIGPCMDPDWLCAFISELECDDTFLDCHSSTVNVIIGGACRYSLDIAQSSGK